MGWNRSAEIIVEMLLRQPCEEIPCQKTKPVTRSKFAKFKTNIGRSRTKKARKPITDNASEALGSGVARDLAEIGPSGAIGSSLIHSLAKSGNDIHQRRIAAGNYPQGTGCRLEIRCTRSNRQLSQKPDDVGKRWISASGEQRAFCSIGTRRGDLVHIAAGGEQGNDLLPFPRGRQSLKASMTHTVNLEAINSCAQCRIDSVGTMPDWKRQQLPEELSRLNIAAVT